ncbi:ComEC/Rec2 family competence protein [Aestuariivirga sp.]|uniref:ComEC/Rec2 family competence protein n=1 Tax=Aestuariivirga sp. TaxID=2650926 RepID=UPI003BAD3DF2
MSAAAMEHEAADRAPLWWRLAEAVQRAADAQRGRSFLWCAPALGTGIGAYFALPAEPGLPVAALAAVLGLVLLWFGQPRPLLLLSGLASIGFALAALQAGAVATPILTASTDEVAVTARVISVDRLSKARLVMIAAPEAIEGLSPEKTPRRLRLSLTETSGKPAAGNRVSFKARLSPLPSPIEPEGFDYGRSLWFQGIGGTGRVTSPFIVLDSEATLASRLDGGMAEVRAAMGARIRAVLEEPYASFAEALITGERSAIPPEINQSLLVSGLYHILSISGLHMWLVAGGVFYVVRAVLALVPQLALRFPIRKWAAGAALLMALFYMLLADSGVATARSFIMVAIVFFAVMVDRPALSLRNLALAAILVLVPDPEAVTQAGFQMSFLAVLGLIAFHEAWARYRAGKGGETPRSWPVRLLRWGVAAFTVSLFTSLVAGFSSSLPAAYHFGRVSPYGVLANGLAIPVVGIAVMPEALLAAVLMPLGLERLPLLIMGKGLELVILISNFVASLPGANEVVAKPPSMAMVTIAAGLILLCLLSGPIRLTGVAVMALGALLILRAPPPPDLLIEATGQNAVLRDEQGHLVPAKPRRARFAITKWLLANGEETSFADAAKRPGWRCAGDRCTAVVRGKRVLYLSGDMPEPLDCAGFDVLIAAFPLRGACRSVPFRIDRFDLWRSGAHALRLTGGTVEIRTARQGQGDRPWTVKPEARRKTVSTAPGAAPSHPID